MLTSKILLLVAELSLLEENSVVLPMTPPRTKSTIRELVQATLVTVMAAPHDRYTMTQKAALYGSKKISMADLSNLLIVMVVQFRSMTVISEQLTLETTIR